MIPVREITLTRREGPASLCDRPYVTRNYHSPQPGWCTAAGRIADENTPDAYIAGPAHPGGRRYVEVGKRRDRPPRARYEGGFAMWTPTGVTQKNAVVTPVYVTFLRSRAGIRHHHHGRTVEEEASPPASHRRRGRPGYFSGSPVIHRLSRESTPVRGGGKSRCMSAIFSCCIRAISPRRYSLSARRSAIVCSR